MTSARGITAPQRVEDLEPRWEKLSEEQRERLAYRWMDHCVRDVLAPEFERQGFPEFARQIGAQPEIVDLGTLAQAEVLLSSIVKAKWSSGVKADLPFAVVASAICALTFMIERPQISNACFMTVMTSRMVFGDDRLLQLMEKDLVDG